MISTGYSMTLSTIWKKHTKVSFSKTIKTEWVQTISAIWGLWKTHKFVFFQIAQEAMLLPIYNKHEKGQTLYSTQNW